MLGSTPRRDDCRKAAIVVLTTIMLCASAWAELSIRYVATNGDDEANDGKSASTPFASVAKGVEDLGAGGGRVYVAAGTYTIAAGDPEIVLSNAVEVVGMTGDPKDVVIQRPSAPGWNDCPGRLFKLGNASSRLQYLTLYRGKTELTGEKGDKDKDSGGNVWITADGGTVEDCILRAGTTERIWAAGGGNVYMQGGRLSRCRLYGGKNNINKQDQWVYSGGSIAAFGGVIENCFITECSSGSAPIGLYESARMINCTIAGNTSGVADVVVGAKNGTGELPSLINCAFFNNGSVAVVSNSILRSAVTAIDYAANAFHRCYSDRQITEQDVAILDPKFVNAADGDYRLALNSPLVNAGSDYEGAGGLGEKDVDGLIRIAGQGVDIGAFENNEVRDIYPAEASATVEGGEITLRISLTSYSLAASVKITDYREGLPSELRYCTLKPNGSVELKFSGGGSHAFKIAMRDDEGRARDIWASCFVPDASIRCRFVSLLGKDENDGLSSGNAMRSILAAQLSLGDEGGTIYLAPGTYAGEGYGPEGKTNAFYISTPVQVIGLAGNPTETILNRGPKCGRVLKIVNANAAVRCVTISGGEMFNGVDTVTHGGNVWVAQAGGSLDYCVIRDGKTLNWAAAGANVMLKGGRMRGCVLIGGVVQPKSFTGTYEWAYNGTSLFAEGGIVENCVIRDCYSGSGPVAINYTAKLINCTVVNNTGVICGGVMVGGNGAATAVNCAIFGGSVTSADSAATDVAFRSISRQGNGTENATSAFTGCAANAAINDSCLLVEDPKFEDSSHGRFTPAASSPLVNAAGNYAQTDAISQFDAAGLERNFGSGVDIGAYECQTGSGLHITEKWIAVEGGRVKVRLAIFGKTTPVDVKILVYRDGLLVDRNTIGVAYEFGATLEYDVPGYYVAKCRAYFEGGEYLEYVIGDVFLSGHTTPVRFVAADGLDENDGQTPATPVKSIQLAIDSLGTAGGIVYVAPGTYTSSTEINAYAISNAVTVVGTAVDPRSVKLCKTAATNARILRLVHADAAVRNVWISGGYLYSVKVDGASTSPAGEDGAGVLITTKGGTLENCYVSDGMTYVYAGGGGNICMYAGRVSGCIIEGGCSCNTKDDPWSHSGSSVCLMGGVMENCVIRKAQGRIENGARGRLGGAPVMIYGEAKLINSIVTDSYGNNAGALLVRRTSSSSMKIPSIINCAFYNNRLIVTDAAEYCNVYCESTHSSNSKTTTKEEAQSAFVNCASEIAINESSPAIADPMFLDLTNGNYRVRSASPLINAGYNYVAAGGVSTADLYGMPRNNGQVDIGPCEYPKLKLIPKVRSLTVIIR